MQFKEYLLITGLRHQKRSHWVKIIPFLHPHAVEISAVAFVLTAVAGLTSAAAVAFESAVASTVAVVVASPAVALAEPLDCSLAVAG